jgi:hypothetical protein
MLFWGTILYFAIGFWAAMITNLRATSRGLKVPFWFLWCIILFYVPAVLLCIVAFPFLLWYAKAKKIRL